MRFKEFKHIVAGDLQRVGKPTTINLLKKLITNASTKTTFWHRVYDITPPHSIIRLIISGIIKHYQYKTGIQISKGFPIGKGLYFPHFSSIIIHAERIGENCTIFQGVTIGSVRGKGRPKIGDNVVIGANSTIIGDLTIGNNAFVGAGSVVVKDVPDNAVVTGNPASIKSYKGNKNISLYLH